GRAEALAVAKRLLGIKKERELVDLKKVEGKVLAGWSQVFQKAYYNGYSPGLNRFYSEIKKGAKKHKSKRREL
ncbi:MAG: hypothetical protein QGG64_20360, partial [Candidatus Latescibacteria bacterium]|nr:hypothetical protein [Candidatus Latescibacterota bacterium]